MSQLLISVVINNYNYARFVAQAVESALAQRYPHKEILVVDDGSTDNSREVLEPYAARGVRLIFKENGGQASAFNRGFQEARGEVIAFLDADDYWHPDLLETLASVWRSGVAMTMWRLQGVDENGQLIDYVVPPVSTSMPSGNICRDFAIRGEYPHPPTSGLAFARAALSAVTPIDESTWRISADAPLYTTAPFQGEVLSIDKILGYYRLHGANLWHSQQLSPRGMLRDVHHIVLKSIMLRELAQQANIPHHPRLGLHYPHLVLRRLFFRLLGVTNLPWGNDTVPSLVRAGILTTLDGVSCPSYRERRRYLITFISALVLPQQRALRRVAQHLLGTRDKDAIESLISRAYEELCSENNLLKEVVR